MPNEYSMICKLHFISEKPSRFPNNPDYVPSIFSFSTSKVARQKGNVDRYERLQARRKRQSELAECERDSEDDPNDSATQLQQPDDVAE